MALTSRKKRPLNHAIPHLRDTRLIIIATEGTVTEKQYFGIFRDTRVQVMVLPTEGGLSSPAHVLARLSTIKREHELNSDDQLWVMVDVDRWTPQMLSAVAQNAVKKGFGMAVSNPCFELWLYLHHADVAAATIFTSQQMKKELSNLLGGYDHTNLQLERFQPFVDDAVRRADELDLQPNERWPSRTSTHVYRVMKEIQSLRRDREQGR
ncbi:MAG: RloB domain-containing protein [Armatimonadetes bacterium]|nr:RloB domain-containing protein [Armatimonadota bacterium]